MDKALSELTLEELWERFPVILSAPKSCWKDWYLEEEARLLSFLPQNEIHAISIHHIGSTAIRGIWAKPIIDILLEIPRTCSMEAIKQVLTDNGYLCMSESAARKSFNKGYTKDGFAEKVFHLHLRNQGDHDELYFRDYMNQHPELAKQYEALKLSLWKQYAHDRDAYTAAKTSFVKTYTEYAKAHDQNRC